MMTKSWEMTETVANGCASDTIQWELSYEYQHDRVKRMFIIFYFFVHWTNKTSAAEGGKIFVGTVECVWIHISEMPLFPYLITPKPHNQRILFELAQTRRLHYRISCLIHVSVFLSQQLNSAPYCFYQFCLVHKIHCHSQLKFSYVVVLLYTGIIIFLHFQVNSHHI